MNNFSLPLFIEDHLYPKFGFIPWDSIPNSWCDIDQEKYSEFKAFMECPPMDLLAISEIVRFLTESRHIDLAGGIL